VEERRIQKMCSSSKKGGEEVMRPVTIDKLVAGLQVIYTASSNTYALGTNVPTDEWEIDPSTGFCFWRGYIDLSGLRTNDEIFVPSQAQCQHGGTFLGQGASSGLAGGAVFVQYALTTDRVDDIFFGAGTAAEPLAGYIGDNTDFQTIIAGATNTYGPAVNSILYNNVMSNAYGGAIPVVTDRIYIAIRVAFNPPFVSSAYTDAQWYVPPKRFVLFGEVGEIPDHELIYLMAQQYEAQRRVDVT
jgi:hypothetical protein